MNTAAKHLKTHDLAALPDFELGGLLCRPSLLTVERGGTAEVLEPRIMQVLVALAQDRGKVLSRERLVELCWSGRVVGDDAINRCMARLRKLSERLGGFDVETIRRVGYRLTERHAAAGSALAVAPPTFNRVRRRAYAVVGALLVAAIGISTFLIRTRDSSPPLPAATVDEIAALVAADQYAAAYRLAAPLLKGPHDPALDALWEQIVVPTLPRIEASGAAVSFKPFSDEHASWTEVGTTPFTEPFLAPRGALRLKVEKPGFRTGHFVVANPGPSVEPMGPPDGMIAPFQITVPLPLLADESSADADLVLVPQTHVGVTLTGWTNNPLGSYELDMPAFTIARSEVTNREYKEFVDDGGYDNPSYWQGLVFRDAGRELTFQEARERFVDSTGRHGPAGWQLGAYPSGTAQLPVGGISWYEAMAYARYRDAMLPTIHHWVRASQSPYDTLFNTSAVMALESRFSAEGPAPADAEMGWGPWGTVHMLGNAREWILNFAGERAVALGGAWTDYPFSTGYTYPMSPFAREPQNGLRLMPKPDALPAEWQEPITLLYDTLPPAHDPVSDEVFEGMHLQFTHTPEQVQREQRTNIGEGDLWTAELIELSYATGTATTLMLVLPRERRQPLQPVIYGPPWGCCIAKRPNIEALEQLRDTEFVVNSGRALVLPIWTGSYERAGPADLLSSGGDPQREAALGYHRDAARIVDYLETRVDLDTERLGYFGTSHGASDIGAVVLATEPRIKAAVLISGGIRPDSSGIHPMFDIVNYAPRITTPVLLVNGRLDPLYPLEESQKRLFDLLGTARDQKHHQFYDVGHVGYPPNSIARDVTDWFDRYLGSPRTAAALDYDPRSAAVDRQ